MKKSFVPLQLPEIKPMVTITSDNPEDLRNFVKTLFINNKNLKKKDRLTFDIFWNKNEQGQTILTRCEVNNRAAEKKNKQYIKNKIRNYILQ